MRRTFVLGALLVIGTCSLVAAAAQQAPTPGPVEIEKLKDNLYVMKGGGGNSTVFITAAGVVVVDTKNPGWGQPLLDGIKKVTDRPVAMIINTHTHGDHVSGNVEFPAAIEVVSHVNTAANMKAMRPNSSTPAGTPSSTIFANNGNRNMPKRTFSDRLTLGSGADQIDLHYFGAAHTNGDAFVYFPALRVLHVADVFPNTELPIMDANNGGSGVGYAETLTKVLAFSEKNADVLVNGHRPTQSTNADLKNYVGFIGGYVSEVQAAKKAGRTVEEFAAKWTPPAGYTAQAPRVLSDARLIYNETR